MGDIGYSSGVISTSVENLLFVNVHQLTLWFLLLLKF